MNCNVLGSERCKGDQDAVWLHEVRVDAVVDEILDEVFEAYIRTSASE